MFRNFTCSTSGGVGSGDAKNETEVLTHKRNGTTAAEGEVRQKRGRRETNGQRRRTKQDHSVAKAMRGGNKQQKKESAGARMGCC